MPDAKLHAPKATEIVVISGKGGTGKTSLTAAFAHLAFAKGTPSVLADLDVDAPDLHLLLHPEAHATHEFISGNEAVIHAEICTACGQCATVCRFDAIRQDGGAYTVDPGRCEGCKVCVALCPAKAIDFPARHCGTWFESSTRFGPMVHAQLFPGQENSGRLVAVIKQRARESAAALGAEIILCDGAPGIGCPVISSLSGADMAVAVTEPTPSGRHDLERVAQLCGRFRIPLAVVINKADLNSRQAAEIQSYCQEHGHGPAVWLPFDEAVVHAMVQGRAVTEINDHFTRIITDAWAKIVDRARKPAVQALFAQPQTEKERI